MASINQNQGLTVVQSWLLKLIEANKEYDKEFKELMKKRADTKASNSRKREAKEKQKPIAVEPVKAPKEVKRLLPGRGFVYLLRSSNGFHKVGMTINIKKRLAGIRIQVPVQIDVIHYIASNDYRNVERFVHKKFARKRVQGEWFNLEPGDVKWFKFLQDYDLDRFC